LRLVALSRKVTPTVEDPNVHLKMLDEEVEEEKQERYLGLGESGNVNVEQ
jgi:hypothetical protein